MASYQLTNLLVDDYINTVNDISCSQLNTNIIVPGAPNASLVVQANGIQVFDVQTAGMRANELEVDYILSKTAGPLTLGGGNTTVIQMDNFINLNSTSIVPITDGVSNLGSSSERFDYVNCNHFTMGKANYSQTTNITTTVPITGSQGAFQITTQSSSLGSGLSQSFTVNNLSVVASSYVFCQLVTYSGVPITQGIPIISITSVVNENFTVTISNYGANALDGTFILRFLVV